MHASLRFARKRRRGGVTLELILALPVVVVLLVAIFEYASLMILQPAVTHAATVGAREAGKCPDIEEVTEAVSTVLAGNCIAISDAADSGTKVVLEVYGFPPLEFGDPGLICNLPANPLNPDEVRVTVSIALDATGFCDALHEFGFSLSGCRLQASSLVKKEQT